MITFNSLAACSSGKDIYGDDTQLDAGKIQNWADTGTVISFFFYVYFPGMVRISLVASRGGSIDARIMITVANTPVEVKITEDASTVYSVGEFAIATAGYVRVDMQGITGTPFFPDVSALQVEASGVVCANIATLPGGFESPPEPKDKDQYYRFARRGPSLYLRFPGDYQYFYTEVGAFDERDRMGSYFSTQFNGGYCGIQRTKQTPKGQPCEAVALFSIWNVSKELKTSVVKIGSGVQVNKFGGEGEGSQTFMTPDWSADKIYRFVVRATPTGADTLFTAWFNAGSGWLPIATILRPGINQNLGGMVHFLENFTPENGWLERMGFYTNDWGRASGATTWTQITTAILDGDEVARKRQRLDFGAGAAAGRFWMANGGFGMIGSLTQADGSPVVITRDASPNQMPVDVDKDLPEPNLPPPKPPGTGQLVLDIQQIPSECADAPD